MVNTHKQAIAGFMPGIGLGLERNPPAGLEIGPLCFKLDSGGRKCLFDLQFPALNP